MSTLVMERPPLNEFKIGTLPSVYTVFIHKNEDDSGYWATCPMPNGGANTMGDTIREVQTNMFESMDLFLEDSPDISDYVLNFVFVNE